MCGLSPWSCRNNINEAGKFKILQLFSVETETKRKLKIITTERENNKIKKINING
jgi:hypothetical protein